MLDCRPVGSGATALKYLAPYIFRIALSNNRIERLVNDEVIFRYTDGKTGEKKRTTLPADTFISRFLAHVLPKGFMKVRYYGLLCPSKRHHRKEARSLLALQQAAKEPALQVVAPQPERAAQMFAAARRAGRRCSCSRRFSRSHTTSGWRIQSLSRRAAAHHVARCAC